MKQDKTFDNLVHAMVKIILCFYEFTCGDIYCQDFIEMIMSRRKRFNYLLFLLMFYVLQNVLFVSVL